jgi:hypothetical protein
MSIVLSLNVPAGDGVGTAGDTTGQDIEKTLVVGGTFTGSVVIEASMGGDFVPVATLTAPASKAVRVAATQFRVRRAAVDAAAPGTPVVDVIAESAANAFQQLDVPAGDGVGASSDITSLGDEITAIATGNFAGAGALTVEISGDNVNWAALGRSFAAPDHYTVVRPAKWARVRRAGVTFGGVPVVYVGSVTTQGTGIGGIVRSTLTSGSYDVYVDADNGDDSNSGLSAADAVQTLAAIYEKFPTEVNPPASITVWLAAGNGNTQAVYEADPVYIGNNSDDQLTYRYIGPEFIPFTPATGPASANLDAATFAQQADGNGSVSGSGRRSRLNFTTAAPGWTPSDFAGKALARITRGGTRVIYEIPISDNTADAIFIDDVDVLGQVAANDLVEIVIPGARIESPNFFLSFIGKGAPSFSSIVAAQFQRLSLDTFVLTNGNMTMDRCDNKSFYYGGIVKQVNCFRDTGDSISGTAGTASLSPQTVPGGTDPLNTAVFMHSQTAGPNAKAFFGPSVSSGNPCGGGGYLVGVPYSVRNTATVSDGLLQVGSGMVVKFFEDLILSVAGGGSGSLVEIQDNSVLWVPPRTQVDVIAAPTNGITMLASGLSIPFTNGVGGFYEVAGYNGNFFDPPSAPGDTGDFSNVRERP